MECVRHTCSRRSTYDAHIVFLTNMYEDTKLLAVYLLIPLSLRSENSGRRLYSADVVTPTKVR